MSEKDKPNVVGREQEKQIQNMLQHGAGVTAEQIATALGTPFTAEEVEAHLLKEIAKAGKVRRRWNSKLHDHFYVVED